MANPYFNAVYYLQQNPDVFSAGYTVATAWDHYVKHGADEANITGGTFRAPNPWFDVKYYLANNPDLIRAGITPATALDHFLNYGSKAAEDRAPNAAIAAAPITEAKLLAYALANADLQKAFGISASATTLTADQQTSLLNHFYSYGYSESRPDAPAAVVTPQPSQGATFTLTPGTDLAGTTSASNSGIASDFRFTAGSEKVEAGAGTLQATDVLLDASTADNDQLNATLTGASGAFTAQNIEVINTTFVNAAANLQLNNVVGTKTVNVGGTTAGQVSGLNAQASVSPTIAVNGYTNTVTVLANDFSGAAATNNAETVNLSVSGASWGTTAATQTSIVVDATVNGTLETLNLSSNGKAANTFALAAGAGDSFGKINVTGEADATIRIAHAQLTGVAVDANNAKGSTTLSVDRAGQGTASTNVTNVKGVDQYVFRDAGQTAALVATNVEAGAKITAVNNFAANSSISVAGAATATDNVLSLTLDHATANTSLSIAGLNIQNVETLNIVSTGNSSAALAAGNTIGTGGANELVGDFSKIEITGDTAITLNVDIDAPATGNFSTTIDASGLTGTAAARISASGDADATNRYVITGSSNADTITGGAGNDTIAGGAGNDTINLTAGTDRLTGGEGRDTFVTTAGVMGSTGAAVSTITDFVTGTGEARDFLQVASGSVGAAGYYEGGAAGLVAGTAYSVIVLTDAAYANAAAASAAIAGFSASATPAVVVYLNETTGFAQAYLDNALNAGAVAATNTDFAVFENITTLVGVQAFDTVNFTVV